MHLIQLNFRKFTKQIWTECYVEGEPKANKQTKKTIKMNEKVLLELKMCLDQWTTTDQNNWVIISLIFFPILDTGMASQNRHFYGARNGWWIRRLSFTDCNEAHTIYRQNAFDFYFSFFLLLLLVFEVFWSAFLFARHIHPFPLIQLSTFGCLITEWERLHKIRMMCCIKIKVKNCIHDSEECSIEIG